MENQENKILFLENIPSVFLLFTAFSFILSIFYNFMYFQILGIDLHLLPLTVVDYTLTPIALVRSLASVFFGIITGALISKFMLNKNTEFVNETESFNSEDRVPIVNMILYINLIVSLVFSLLSTFYNFFEVYKVGIYALNLALMYFTLIFMALFFQVKFNFIVKLVNLLKYHLFCLFIIFSSIVIMVILAQSSAIKDYFLPIPNKIKIESEVYSLVRAFDKGALILHENKEISFVFYDGSATIHFGKNEKLIKYHELKEKLPSLRERISDIFKSDSIEKVSKDK